MHNIEICERLMDNWTDYSSGEGVQRPKYHAQIKNQPGTWGCGINPYEAVGNLVYNHPEMFGAEMNFLGKLPR